jgi:hypothetical protein
MPGTCMQGAVIRMMPDKTPAMNMRPCCPADPSLDGYMRSGWGADVAHLRGERGGRETERAPEPDAATLWDSFRAAIRNRHVDAGP